MVGLQRKNVEANAPPSELAQLMFQGISTASGHLDHDNAGQSTMKSSEPGIGDRATNIV